MKRVRGLDDRGGGHPGLHDPHPRPKHSPGSAASCWCAARRAAASALPTPDHRRPGCPQVAGEPGPRRCGTGPWTWPAPLHVREHWAGTVLQGSLYQMDADSVTIGSGTDSLPLKAAPRPRGSSSSGGRPGPSQALSADSPRGVVSCLGFCADPPHPGGDAPPHAYVVVL